MERSVVVAVLRGRAAKGPVGGLVAEAVEEEGREAAERSPPSAREVAEGVNPAEGLVVEETVQGSQSLWLWENSAST